MREERDVRIGIIGWGTAFVISSRVLASTFNEELDDLQIGEQDKADE